MLLTIKECSTLWPDPSRSLAPIPAISNSPARVRTGSGAPIASLSGEKTFGQSRIDSPPRTFGPVMIRLVGALTFKLSIPGNSAATTAATNRFQLAMDTDTGDASKALVAKYERDFYGLTWEGNAGLDEDVINLFQEGKIRHPLLNVAWADIEDTNWRNTN